MCQEIRRLGHLVPRLGASAPPPAQEPEAARGDGRQRGDEGVPQRRGVEVEGEAGGQGVVLLLQGEDEVGGEAVRR